jgi:hypothetical protein
MTRIPELLLFDLGGILVEFSGSRGLPPLLRIPLSPSDIQKKWTASPTLRAVETGHLTPPEFAELFVQQWGVAVSSTELLSAFRSWTRGLLPGARDVPSLALCRRLHTAPISPCPHGLTHRLTLDLLDHRQRSRL